MSTEISNVAELLGQYFSTRGRFLAQVISADLESVPSHSTSERIATATPAPDERVRSIEKANELPATQAELIAIKAPEVSTPTEVTVNRYAEILDNLKRLISARTGFPLDSIKTEYRLLDDLNLDSIKAGELIAQAAASFQLNGSIDPVTYANATLIEITNAIADLAAPAANVAEPKVVDVTQLTGFKLADIIAELRRLTSLRTGFPEDSIGDDLYLLDDLNLDSIKAGELIAAASNTFGVGGSLDPVALANPSLRVIAEEISKQVTSPIETKVMVTTVDPRPILIAATVAERTGFALGTLLTAKRVCWMISISINQGG